MKKLIFTLILTVFGLLGFAQNYNNIVNYALNGTPVNGIKIITNLPFTPGSQMPTIVIHGYNYGGSNNGGPGAIDLTLTYYIYDFGSGPVFVHYSIVSAGIYTPPVSLSNEGGKVVIFLNDKPYYPRFSVSAFAQGMSQDISANYSGWTVADAALTGTGTVSVPYANTFPGIINLPGGGILNASGALALGTNNPYTYMLAVNGSAIATSMTVKLKSSWPDFVFKKGYQLPSLTAVETYIDQNHHLPEMPSEAQVSKEGINLGEMNKLLTKKVEELTLYLIDKDKKDADKQAQIDLQKKQLNAQQQEIDELKSQVKALLKSK